MINLKVIKKLNPCKDRLDNYISFYSDKSFSPRQFMGLKNITHNDKLWVAFRVLPLASLRAIAVDIAESVLHLYEEKCPNDARPREAIAAARAYARGEITLEHLQEKKSAAYAAAHVAHAAAYSAAHAAAYSAGNAAAYAAAYAGYTAAYAAAAFAASDAYSAGNAAAYAAYADYAASDAYSAGNAAHAGKQKQEKLIRTIILKYWKLQFDFEVEMET